MWCGDGKDDVMNVIRKINNQDGFIGMMFLILFAGIMCAITITLMVIPIIRTDIRQTVRKAVDGACLKVEADTSNEYYINQPEAYNAFLQILQTNLELDGGNNPIDSNGFITGQVTVDAFFIYDKNTTGLPILNPLDNSETLTRPSVYAQLSIPYTFGSLGSLLNVPDSTMRVAVVVSAEDLP
jgi:hypothetical protein